MFSLQVPVWALWILRTAALLLIAACLIPRWKKRVLAGFLLLCGTFILYEASFLGTSLVLSRQVPKYVDLWGYVSAARVYYEQRLDPYWNKQIRWAWNQGKLSLPGPAAAPLGLYGLQMNFCLEDQGGRGSIGYAGSPVLLAFHYGLYRCLGFWGMARFLMGLSLITLWASLFFFARRLFQISAERCGQLAIATFSALGFFAPLTLSLQLGQLEGLYVPFVALAVYLLAFHRTRPNGNLNSAAAMFSGLCLAIAAAIKIYPALLGGCLLPMALARKRQTAFFETPEGRAFLWFTAGAVLLTIGTLGAFGPALADSFRERIRLLAFSITSNLHEYRPSLYDYLIHLLERLRPGGSDPQTAAYVHQVTGGIGALLGFFGWKAARCLAVSFPEPGDPRPALLGFSWLLAALPLLLKHWWSYYGVIQFIPILVVLFWASRISDWKKRANILLLLTAGCVLANPETLRFLLWLGGVDSMELPFLITTPGSVHLIPPGWPAFLFGFPGQLLIFCATWQVVAYACSSGGSPKVIT